MSDQESSTLSSTLCLSTCRHRTTSRQAMLPVHRAHATGTTPHSPDSYPPYSTPYSVMHIRWTTRTRTARGTVTPAPLSNIIFSSPSGAEITHQVRSARAGTRAPAALRDAPPTRGCPGPQTQTPRDPRPQAQPSRSAAPAECRPGSRLAPHPPARSGVWGHGLEGGFCVTFWCTVHQRGCACRCGPIP